MRNYYSQKEQDLFISLGFENLLDVIDVPPSLYEIVAIDCFSKNLTGKSVDSLRRCVTALNVCNPYRMTDEFDALIQL